MKTAFLSVMAATSMARFSTALPQSDCDIVCIEPFLADFNAVPPCNCFDRFCPAPGGPDAPPIPDGLVWGWNEAENACGPVAPGEECAGLEVTCRSGFSFGWNGRDTCTCLPILPKRQNICRIFCAPPSSNDPNAVPNDCNCARETCPPPQGPGGPNIPEGQTWGFNATSRQCGPVVNPQAECASLSFECRANFTYGWYGPASACECIPDYFH
ncbi:hypothetical protein PVAG01_00109 [Phlyctema vagabunda]|uniref:Uncharacterized protein n=1 Tax=Phlyctema vagabunda TaxID=108571 RepID=A0ABR4PTD0_9HELO